jgi:hypothetical protein
LRARAWHCQYVVPAPQRRQRQPAAAAFTNPDHVYIVIYDYRWRLKLAPGEPRYDGLDAKLAAKPVITVPTITIGSDFRVSMDSALMVHLRYQASGHRLWRPLDAHSLQLGAVDRGHSRYLCDQLRYASNSSSAGVRGGRL